jgi:hypothetical protein
VYESDNVTLPNGVRVCCFCAHCNKIREEELVSGIYRNLETLGWSSPEAAEAYEAARHPAEGLEDTRPSNARSLSPNARFD